MMPISGTIGLLLQKALASGQPALTAEVMPPRGGDPSRSLAAAGALRDWVHAVNVTDGSRAVMRMSSLALCRLLLDAGIDKDIRGFEKPSDHVPVWAQLDL